MANAPTPEHLTDVWSFYASAVYVEALVGCDTCPWRRTIRAETAEEVERQVAEAIGLHQGED